MPTKPTTTSGVLGRLLRQGDLYMIFGLFGTVLLLILPVPPIVLDMLLAVSIALSLLILLIILYNEDPVLRDAQTCIGVLSPNEIREKEDMPPRAGGDTYMDPPVAAPAAPVQPAARANGNGLFDLDPSLLETH